MNETGTIVVNTSGNPNLSLDQGPSFAALEQRVQKLETVVATLQDTQVIEKRVLEKLTRQLEKTPTPAEQFTRELPPAISPAPSVSQSPPASEPGPRWWQKWRREEVATPLLFFDLLSEIKNMVGMFFDHRFQVAWSTKIIALVLLPAILTVDWWFPPAWLPFVGGFFARLLDLFLGFFIYKALSRDARRFQEARARNGQ